MMLSRENSVDRTVAYAPYVSVHKELVQQAFLLKRTWSTVLYTPCLVSNMHAFDILKHIHAIY